MLQMPMRRASREHPDERTFLLKSMDKISELPDASLDIESDNLIKRYQRRPRQLEQLCLADFAAWYNCVKSDDLSPAQETESKMLVEEYPPERNFDDNTDDDPSHYRGFEFEEQYYLKGGMKLVKRKKSMIIRSVHFNKSKDPENYFREQLMLYTPWRDENKDLNKELYIIPRKV